MDIVLVSRAYVVRVYAGSGQYLNLIEVEVYDALGTRLQLSNGALGAAYNPTVFKHPVAMMAITGSSGDLCHSKNDPGKNYVSFAFSTAALEVTVSITIDATAVIAESQTEKLSFTTNTPSLTEQNNIINPGVCASKEYTLKLSSLIGGKHTIADSVI